MLRYVHILNLLYFNTADQISADAKSESLPRNEDGKQFHLNCLRFTTLFNLLHWKFRK